MDAPRPQNSPATAGAITAANAGKVASSRGFGRVRATTASSRIHLALRERIVALDLPPGAALSEQDLAEAFGVSRTPVREALLRLSEEDLVDIYPQSGTFVARLRASAAHDAMAIRRALERLSVREAARRALRTDVAALDALLGRQKAAAEANDIAAFHAEDEAMHQTIANTAGHPNIWRVVKREKANVDRVRLLTLEFAGRFEIVLTEHRRIVDAIRRADIDAAEAAMEAHLSRVLPSLEAIRERHPDYFEIEGAPQTPPRRAQSRAGRG